MWEREEEFRGLLRRAAGKASKELLDTLADIAVRDDKVVSRGLGTACNGQHRAAERLCPGAPLRRCHRVCHPMPPTPHPHRPLLPLHPRPQAYKAVCALVVHEMKQAKMHHRLRLLYAASTIMRHSKARRKDRDKYGACGDDCGGGSSVDLLLCPVCRLASACCFVWPNVRRCAWSVATSMSQRCARLAPTPRRRARAPSPPPPCSRPL